MINLLNIKLELVKKIEELTQNILEITLDNDDEFESSLNKFNELLDERQDLIDEIEILDSKLDDLFSKSNKDADVMDLINQRKSVIKALFKDIVAVDEKIRQNTEKELILIKRKLNELDQRSQKSDFEINEEDKKPTGYYLNKKS